MKKSKFLLMGLMFMALSLTVAGCQTTSEPVEPGTDEPMVIGGDKDEHGCYSTAGYLWCEEKQKCLRVFEEFCTDEVVSLMNDIKTDTAIELVSAGQGEFSWSTEDSSLTIPAVVYQKQGLTKADYTKLETYFNAKAETDINNEADGVEGGSRGYVYHYMACQLSYTHVQLVEGDNGVMKPEGDNINVNIKCGFYNPNLL